MERFGAPTKIQKHYQFKGSHDPHSLRFCTRLFRSCDDPLTDIFSIFMGTPMYFIDICSIFIGTPKYTIDICNVFMGTPKYSILLFSLHHFQSHNIIPCIQKNAEKTLHLVKEVPSSCRPPCTRLVPIV